MGINLHADNCKWNWRERISCEKRRSLFCEQCPYNYYNTLKSDEKINLSIFNIYLFPAIKQLSTRMGMLYFVSSGGDSRVVCVPLPLSFLYALYADVLSSPPPNQPGSASGCVSYHPHQSVSYIDSLKRAWKTIPKWRCPYFLQKFVSPGQCTIPRHLSKL